MKRWVFNTLWLVSFVLCVSTIVMWVRSHYRCDLVGFWTQHSINRLWWATGDVRLFSQPIAGDSPSSFGVDECLHYPASEEIERYEGESFLGIRHGEVFTSMAHKAWWVHVPIAYGTIACGFLPALSLARRWKRVRRK